MKYYCFWPLVALCCAISGYCDERVVTGELEGKERGPFQVGSTNMAIAPKYTDISDDAMHDALLGRLGHPEQRRFVIEMMQHSESTWITEVSVPDEPALYGPASGSNLPALTFLVFPAEAAQEKNPYTFPYADGIYGSFEDMLAPGEVPRFADPDERYPLIILAHGAFAHGLYDVRHAQDLASNGYIVAVITYGDERVGDLDFRNWHTMFLRPLLTKTVLDSILESETFGPHIDSDNIGISGHSFGGFTALAVAGGAVNGNTVSVTDERIKAAAVAAPWAGGNYDGNTVFAFGVDNEGLDSVDIPVMCFFGSNDETNVASFILPATRKLAGPTYVVELVDQPHIFEGGSWEDRNKWLLLFFDAFLKHNPAALEKLVSGRSMKGGNEDFQRFDYQRATGSSSQ
jgi:dienelactone hydrolase